MRRSGLPHWSLGRQRRYHTCVIQHINPLVQRREPGLVRQQLREGDLAFARLRELRPELSDAPIEADVLLLEDMQQAGAPKTFRSRPK